MGINPSALDQSGNLPQSPFTAVKKTDDEWVKELIELHEYSDRKRFLAWQRWNEAWRLYNNQYDFSSKANWQSTNFVPKLSMAVEMAASLVRRAMIDANEWFRYDGTSETSRKIAPYLEKIAYWYLDQLHFIDEFMPPMKGGMVGSLIALKLHLAPYVLEGETEEQLEKRLRGELIRRQIIEGPAITISYPDPYNLWLDPAARNMFVIERETMDMSTAYDLADVGILDGDVLKKIQEDYVDSFKAVREEQRRQQMFDIQRPSFRTEVELLHFWGSLPKKFGRWAIRNGHFVIANRKYLIRKPMDNPYKHQKLPYVIGTPFRRPFSVYHKGLIEDVVGLQKAMTELLNLTLDSALFSGIKAFEVDLDQIEDPQQILNGIYPGKVFTARKGGQNTKMIQDIEIQGVAKEIVSIYQMLNSEYQNQTAVTEFITGAQTMGQEKTATEVITKQHQGMGIFGEMARNLEGTVLEPALERLAWLIADFHQDFTSPAIVEILGSELAAEMMILSADDRLIKWQPDKMKVRASGITALLNRTEELQKIDSMMQGLGQLGQMLPMMMQDMDVPYFFKNLFRRWVRAFGWNELDLIKPKTAEQVAAEQAAAATPGASPGGAGSPPSNAANAPAPPTSPQVAGQMNAIQGKIAGGRPAPSPAGGIG